VRSLRALPVLLFFTVWEMIVRLGVFPAYLLSPPSAVLATFFRLLLYGDLLTHICYSLFRALSGFALAVAVGVPLGLAIGWSKLADDLCSPLIELFRPLPAVALIPVAILWLGIGDAFKIFIIFFACFFSILLNTVSGAKNLDVTLVKAARSMGANDGQVLRRVIFPGALPSILTGMRIALGVSLVLLVVSEMIAASYGLGYLIRNAELTFKTDVMYAGIFTIGILGYALNEVMMLLTRRLLRWRPEMTE